MVNVGGSARRCCVSRNGACGQAARPAKLGSRGCQSPGWVVRVCGRGARVMCAGVQAAEPAEAAAAKKDVRDS